MTRKIRLALAALLLLPLAGCMEEDATLPMFNPGVSSAKPAAPSAKSPDATIRMENRTF
jgi:ABC-type uncharacterized transport system auxiliary subunit